MLTKLVYQNHFRVLVKEFQALGLDVQVVGNDDSILEFKDIEEDEDGDEPFRIEEIELPTSEVEENIEPFDDMADEEDDLSLDDLEFPGDIEDTEVE